MIAPIVPEDTTVTKVSRGQRVSAKDLESSELKIEYEHSTSIKPVDIDRYVFLFFAGTERRDPMKI